MLRGAPGATAPGASVYAVCDCVWLCVAVRIEGVSPFVYGD